MNVYVLIQEIIVNTSVKHSTYQGSAVVRALLYNRALKSVSNC